MHVTSSAHLFIEPASPIRAYTCVHDNNRIRPYVPTLVTLERSGDSPVIDRFWIAFCGAVREERSRLKRALYGIFDEGRKIEMRFAEGWRGE